MKNILTLLFFILVIGIAGFMLLNSRIKIPDAKKAAHFAATGDCTRAVSAYASVVTGLTDAKNAPAIPDKYQAANLNPQSWHKPVSEFVDWLLVSHTPSQKLLETLEAMAHCTTNLTHENFIFNIKKQAADSLAYMAKWQQLFYPEMADGAFDSASAAPKAFQNGLSVLSISGNSIYSYEIHLICPATGRQINAAIPCDQVISFPVKPGQYLAIVSSRKMFSAGQSWFSAKEALPFEVSDSVAIITASLRTEVSRIK